MGVLYGEFMWGIITDFIAWRYFTQRRDVIMINDFLGTLKVAPHECVIRAGQAKT